MRTEQIQLRPRTGTSEVQRARRAVGRFCRDMPGHVRAKAQLLTSELVVNALQHGDGSPRLRMSRGDRSLRIEVADEAPIDTFLRGATDPRVRGRGLKIVDMFASRWGVFLASGKATTASVSRTGKAVWFTLNAPRP